VFCNNYLFKKKTLETYLLDMFSNYFMLYKYLQRKFIEHVIL